MSFVAPKLITPTSMTDVDFSRDFTKRNRRGGAYGAAPRRFPGPHLIDGGQVVDDPNRSGKRAWPPLLVTGGHMLVSRAML